VRSQSLRAPMRDGDVEPAFRGANTMNDEPTALDTPEEASVHLSALPPDMISEIAMRVRGLQSMRCAVRFDLLAVACTRIQRMYLRVRESRFSPRVHELQVGDRILYRPTSSTFHNGVLYGTAEGEAKPGVWKLRLIGVRRLSTYADVQAQVARVYRLSPWSDHHGPLQASRTVSAAAAHAASAAREAATLAAQTALAVLHSPTAVVGGETISLALAAASTASTAANAATVAASAAMVVVPLGAGPDMLASVSDVQHAARSEADVLETNAQLLDATAAGGMQGSSMSRATAQAQELLAAREEQLALEQPPGAEGADAMSLTARATQDLLRAATSAAVAASVEATVATHAASTMCALPITCGTASTTAMVAQNLNATANALRSRGPEERDPRLVAVEAIGAVNAARQHISVAADVQLSVATGGGEDFMSGPGSDAIAHAEQALTATQRAAKSLADAAAVAASDAVRAAAAEEKATRSSRWTNRQLPETAYQRPLGKPALLRRLLGTILVVAALLVCSIAPGLRGSHTSMREDPRRLSESAVSSWLAAAQQGFCDGTIANAPYDCQHGEKGSFGLSIGGSRTLNRAVHVCMQRCYKCHRCTYISLNPDLRDCSWYAKCRMDDLEKAYDGFLSGPVPKLGRDRPGAGAALPGRRNGTGFGGEPQELLLFVHLEKTAGTLVRSTMAANGWWSPGYCDHASVLIRDVVNMLKYGDETRLFVEHHCNINWKFPAMLLKAVQEYEQGSGRSVRFRSFTVLRSPTTLVHSQFAYWHSTAKILPRQLYYELSPELLLFRDGLKYSMDEACDEDDDLEGGGLFLGLPLENRRPGNVCAASPWRALCRRVLLALVEHLMLPSQALVDPSLLVCNLSRPTAMYEAAIALNATSPNATFVELSGTLAGMCAKVQLRVLHVAECLVGHAERVSRTVRRVGCNELIRKALFQLGNLSHVFFADVLTFSLDHPLGMARRDQSDGQQPQHHGGAGFANVGVHRVPFIGTEIEPFNKCSLRLYGKVFSTYTARIPYFTVLRDYNLPHLLLHQQVSKAIGLSTVA